MPRHYQWICIGLLLAVLAACQQQDSSALKAHGYVESRFTLLSSPIGGTLTRLPVKRGQAVKPGQLLFQLDQEPVEADLQAAIAHVAQAEAMLADLKKGKRESEIDALIARRREVEASRVFARKEVKRYRSLFKQNHVEESRFDLAVRHLAQLNAERDRLQADLKTARLPARVDAVKAAREQLAIYKARLKRVRWTLKQTRLVAPQLAYVYDTFYRVGEEVPSHRPVVSLIIPQAIKAVFFVDATALSSLHLGKAVEVRCTGCHKAAAAKVVFISHSAEYTPPVIYSEESREKLVYRVEVAFDQPLTPQSSLHPGQPVAMTWSKTSPHRK